MAIPNRDRCDKERERSLKERETEIGSAIALHITKIKHSPGLTLQSFINAVWRNSLPPGHAQKGRDISICMFVVIRSQMSLVNSLRCFKGFKRSGEDYTRYWAKVKTA